MIFDWLIIISLAVVVIILARHVPAVLMKMHGIPKDDTAGEILRLQSLGKVGTAVGKMTTTVSGQLVKGGTTLIKVVKKSGAKSVFDRIRLAIPQRSAPAAQKIEQAEEITESQASRLFETKRFREAERMYLKLCAKEPHNAHLLAQLGIVYMELKNFRDARDAFQAAIKEDPTIPSRHVNLGIALLELNYPKEAMLAFGKALALKPGTKKYQSLYELAKART